MRTSLMTLDDERIERYSRQLILAEVGPRGQERLLAARVAVVGTTGAAERVIAYLAAAGVGWIACDPALRTAVDPATRDVTLASVADAERDGVDTVVVAAEQIDDAANALAPWRARGTNTLWVAGGRGGMAVPCPRCAERATPSTEPPPELRPLRDAFLATVIATETLKRLLAVGTSLHGRVLAYDPSTAAVTTVDVAADPECACAAAAHA